MSGQSWRFATKQNFEEGVPHLKHYLCERWDWEKPLCLKASVYTEERSLTQNALFHIWCRELAKHFKLKTDVDEDDMKMLMKHKFLGTADLVIGSTTIPAQVKQTRLLDKGEMHYFMNEVYDWATDHGVTLSNPEDSQYFKLSKEQVR